MDEFTTRLYSVAQIREIEARAIAGGVAGYTLMQRAAQACWRESRRLWPETKRVTVVCGSGNNGGDGYEFASLARQAGCAAGVLQVGAPPARGDGLRARQEWMAGGGSVEQFQPRLLDGADLIVDALFGVGLARELVGEALTAVQAINASAAPVLAVDVPSGLDADSGRVWGAAVEAELTVTLTGRKLGLVTGAAVDQVGELVLDTLDLPNSSYEGITPVGRLLGDVDLQRGLPRRRRAAHKGNHGHVLVVGGNFGMAGAALLAARAALRAGAGLVSVATRAPHAAELTAAQPELMCRAAETPAELRAQLERADVIALGPGLGQDAWSRMALAVCLETALPMVVDADALNLLAQEPAVRAGWVLTPHPGEAARLLGSTSAVIQADRGGAVRGLQQRYGGVAVLKGAGTLVQGTELAVCPAGNPGMGVGGMGDVLSGVIAALVGQGLALESAAQLGVLAHARAGDAAAATGERGLLPSDLIELLRAQVNP